METAVRKATRLDYNPPKQKHLQTLTSLTFQSPGNAASIIDLLDKRLRENSWIIIFKVLITIHTLMRLGDGDKTIAYVETKPSALDTSKLREKSSGVVHIQNIYLYTAYLEQKVIAYRHLRYDYVKNTMGSKEGRLRHLSVKDGLLKETIVLQKQIGSLLKCNFILDDVDNNISLYAFRLLVEDLLVLFQVINESIVNILEHYFAMDKTDARTSLDIYKRFAKQTEDTISFLDRARRLQHELNISIPSVKHAIYFGLSWGSNPFIATAQPSANFTPNQQQPQQQQQLQQQQQQQPKELLDFFTSLENEKVNIFYNPVIQQQPMFTPIMAQPTGHNPFRTNDNSNMMMIPQQQQQQQSLSSILPQQQSMPSMMPQQSMPSMMPQQSTSSMLPQQSTSSMLPQQQTGTANPFRSNTMPQMSTSTPTLPYFNNSGQFQSMGNTPMQNVTNNPFAMSPTSASPQQQQQQPSTIMVAAPMAGASHNPFNTATPKHQQLQPWGSSLF
ncbi:ANTH domain-containing protein [Mucor mucedo]|uniref:ANTH domain-containing protein n=1 Tax=Mucor mucedo TaxID=29922 RepID=UPI0022200C5C|nr:ANTH domain-containing protein [Mucor mucedo]KAI7876483.1 ANTH domain-containing protein [Mucor mucedo]